MNIAIILAGGVGSRMGMDCPKQFLEMAGRTVLEHSVAAFDRHPAIDEIAVVANADFLGLTREVLGRAGFAKLRHIVPGGKERWHSSMAAIDLYRDRPDSEGVNLIFHDAVRPLVSQVVITRVCAALSESRAVAVAVPSVDTLFQVDATGRLLAIPPRSCMRCAQTPQAFRLSAIAEAYRLALARPEAFAPTDDCGTLLRFLPEVPVQVVEGDVRNVKLTYKEQIEEMERMLEA